MNGPTNLETYAEAMFFFSKLLFRNAILFKIVCTGHAFSVTLPAMRVVVNDGQEAQ
jgi:hypothetical protein